jgi:hypothetical protein
MPIPTPEPGLMISDRYDYGYLPPRFFDQILTAFKAWQRANRVRVTSRE